MKLCSNGKCVCSKAGMDGISTTDNYCWLCGSQTIEKNDPKCCGVILSVHSKFCPNCGKKVSP